MEKTSVGKTASIDNKWDQLLQKLNHYVQKEFDTIFEIGDLFLDIESGYGKGAVSKAAKSCGVSTSVARQRLWVSRKIPKTSKLRSSTLSYSQLRAIAGTDDVEGWGNKCLANNWSVAELQEELDKNNAVKAQEDGLPCNYCEQPLSSNKEIVTVRVGNKKSQRYCSVDCAYKALERLAHPTPPTEKSSAELVERKLNEPVGKTLIEDIASE